MAERAVWRPPWYLWSAIGLAMLWLIHRQMPWLLQGHWLFIFLIALVALLLVAAALWEFPPAGMLCAAIALTMFSGKWTNIGLPGFPFVPDRILLVAALLALPLRSPGASGLPRVRIRGVHLLMALVVLYTVASSAAVGTLGSNTGVFGLLDHLGAIPFLMFVVAPVIFAGARERNMLLVTLVGLGAYLGLTAVFEALGPHGLVFPQYIWHVDTVSSTGQAGGPSDEPVTNGFACFACGIAAMIAYSQWRRRWSRGLAAAVAVVSLLGCMLSLERGVWIGLLAAVFAVGFAARDARRWMTRVVAAAAVFIVLLLLVAPGLASHANARAGTVLSVWDRQNQTSAALRMIAAKPLFGFGWDRFTSDDTDYFRQSAAYPLTGLTINEVPLPLHDSYLSNAVELGLVGTLLWFAALLWGLGGAIARPASPELQPWRLGLIAITVMFLVLGVFDPLQQNFTELLLWTWAGIVMSGGIALRQSSSFSEQGLPRRPSPPRERAMWPTRHPGVPSA